jgi:hypothetical protein
MAIIKTIEGDLVAAFLDSANKTITDMAHGCNCASAMGAGIAATVAIRIPLAYEADKQFHKNEPAFMKIGKFSKYVDEFGRGCYNMYTQLLPGVPKSGTDIPCDYDAIHRSFTLMNIESKNSDKKMILGIPRIGCGLAGGDWKKVEGIINSCTPDLDIVLYEFVPDRLPRFYPDKQNKAANKVPKLTQIFDQFA